MTNTFDLTLEISEEVDEIEILSDALLDRIAHLESNAPAIAAAAERDLGDDAGEVEAGLRLEAAHLHVLLLRTQLLAD